MEKKLEKLKTEKSSLLESLGELTVQLKQLKEEKLYNRKLLDEIDGFLDDTEVKEDELKLRLLSLEKREIRLHTKRKKIHARMREINHRLRAISKIKEDLKELGSLEKKSKSSSAQ